jgi:hypothetical protein
VHRFITLTYIQLKGADLTGASLSRAWINGDLIAANFLETNFTGADLTGADFSSANLTRADMSSVRFNNTRLARATISNTTLTGATLSNSNFDDVDVREFCDAKRLKHLSPCSIDCHTVMKSYRHPKLKQFITDCGVPEIFAEYMIDCARACDEPLLRSLMRSTFISYGGPDEAFARKLYKTLRAHQVIVFFFPETATVGERIDNEVFRRIQEHDRILLICSRFSLDRPGVINEIQETLDREARDGGATYLLPIMLDDYVLTGWRESYPELAERISRRIIADFRKAKRSRAAFDTAVERVLGALKRQPVA